MTAVDIRTRQQVTPLTDTEREALTNHEQTIERGFTAFVEVGEALATIRDSRLYRDTHPTWEDYCRDRWGMSRQRAAQLVDAATTVLVVSTIVDNGPAITNEAQARALAPIVKDHGAEVAAEVLAAAAENGEVTAKAIKENAPVAKVTQTNKTETYVDTDTGEIVDQPATRTTQARTVQPIEHTLDEQISAAKADFAIRLAAIRTEMPRPTAPNLRRLADAAHDLADLIES